VRQVRHEIRERVADRSTAQAPVLVPYVLKVRTIISQRRRFNAENLGRSGFTHDVTRSDPVTALGAPVSQPGDLAFEIVDGIGRRAAARPPTRWARSCVHSQPHADQAAPKLTELGYGEPRRVCALFGE
jgi:hypothetical protein